MAFIPSQSEARGHCRPRFGGNVAVGVVGGPYCGPCYYPSTVVVRRPAPAVVERRVYVQPEACATREVVVVEQPCYEEVVYVQRPIVRPSFSFGLSFFR